MSRYIKIVSKIGHFYDVSHYLVVLTSAQLYFMDAILRTAKEPNVTVYVRMFYELAQSVCELAYQVRRHPQGP